LFSASQPRVNLEFARLQSCPLLHFTNESDIDLQDLNSISIPRIHHLKKPQSTISPYSRRASSLTAIIMLRRKPTSITLTTEDVAIYEDSRARENHLREQAVLQAQMQAQGTPQKKTQNIRDPNDELRPLPGDRARAQHVKTRDERLGLMGGGGGSSRA